VAYYIRAFSFKGLSSRLNGKEYLLWFGGAQPLNMQNKKLIRFVESFVIVPLVTLSGPISNIPQATSNMVTAPLIISSQKFNMATLGSLAFNQAPDPKVEEKKVKALAIDTYFKERNMPLEGMGMKMVEEAEKNNLDWRLIAAIAVRESTGGKNECIKVPNNPFGWGSCKIGFTSNEHAIEIVARNLGGNNPNTARHYDNKTTKQILRAYNPPSIVPRYAEQVISIMDTIGDGDLVSTVNS